jgi:hypothetical protein
MKAILVCTIALLASLSAHAQSSYYWTLTPDPGVCGMGGVVCPQVYGYGQFEVSGGRSTTFLNETVYPMTMFEGAINGSSVGLMPGSTGYFYTAVEPINPNFTLYMQSDFPVLKWNIQMTDFKHPGSGQTMYDYQTGMGISVAFSVSLVPHQVIPGAPPAPTFFTPTRTVAPTRRAMNPVAIEISVPAAMAAGVTIYEILHHRGGHREALAAGRF